MIFAAKKYFGVDAPHKTYGLLAGFGNLRPAKKFHPARTLYPASGPIDTPASFISVIPTRDFWESEI